MQGIEETQASLPPVVHAPYRPLPHDTIEDSVVDILRPSEPLLLIVRSELGCWLVVIYWLTPPTSSPYAPGAISRVNPVDQRVFREPPSVFRRMVGM